LRQVYESLVTILTDVSKELGINAKTQNVLGSNDRDTIQLAKLIVESADDMLLRLPWRATIGTNPWVKKEDGSFVYQVTADTDTILIDARVLKLGTKWRYLNAKGLTYAEIFRSCEVRINAFAFNLNRGNVVDENVSRAPETV